MTGEWIRRWAIAVVGASLTFGGTAQALAARSNGIQPYFYLGAGESYFSDADQGAGLRLQNPSQFPFPELGLGVNLNRYLGVELAVDFSEAYVYLAGDRGRLGEYAIWMFLPQVRLRYPLFNDRLVPYAVAGAGLGLGEFNDRNVLNDDIAFGGSQDESFIGAAGLGLEYFVAPNIALGTEAKHVFGFTTDVSFGGQAREFNVDNTLLLAGMRLYLGDQVPTDGPERPPADSDKFRGYLFFHTGGGFFTNPNGPSSIEKTDPVRIWFGAGGGANIDKHWGAELAWDFLEPTLSVPGIGEVAEYTLWSLLAQVRYRYPVMGDRVVPYVLAGGGIGISQINDRRIRVADFPLSGGTATSPMGAVGGGVEYYLVDNIALGTEIRYLFGSQQDVTIGDVEGQLKNDMALVSVSLKVLYP